MSKIKEIVSCEKNLIEIKEVRNVVFIGDTHGDSEATKKVLDEYLEKKDYVLVFLGDYVDRGPDSRGNINLLLEAKTRYPEKIFLLMGNHEAWSILPFSPADFWQSLDRASLKIYKSIFLKLPLVVRAGPVIGLHGALPDVSSLEEVNKIKLGDRRWHEVCWGDFQEVSGENLGPDPFTGRPQFGRDWFEKLMKRFKARVLIRSHQPDFQGVAFDKRCLTIFTSSAYIPRRTIAIADFSRKINLTDDLVIKEI